VRAHRVRRAAAGGLAAALDEYLHEVVWSAGGERA
jgi:hypothetical protein